MSRKTQIILILMLLAVFGIVIWQVEPPENFSQISLKQFLLFFTPLFLGLTLLCRLIIRSLKLALVISFGVILVLIFQGLQILTIYLLGTSIALLIIVSVFVKKPKPRFKPRTIQPQPIRKLL